MYVRFSRATSRRPIIAGIRLDFAIVVDGTIFAEFLKPHVCHFQDSPSMSTFELIVRLLQRDVFPETFKILRNDTLSGFTTV